MYVYQIIMSCTWNWYNVTCQLYLNKAGTFCLSITSDLNTLNAFWFSVVITAFLMRSFLFKFVSPLFSWSCSHPPPPQPQQRRTRAASATYTSAGSPIHLSSWILIGFVSAAPAPHGNSWLCAFNVTPIVFPPFLPNIIKYPRYIFHILVSGVSCFFKNPDFF